MPDIHQILTKYWGHASFRPMQEDIIRSVLDGIDTLALLPTGGGKSICFQVPALAKDGICIVVSPLIALMKDQVQNLNKRGIPAVAVVSGMHRKEIDIALDNCAYGRYKFLYVSPERLISELFLARLQKMNVNLLAIDEAHCIAQWGYDFRPPYLLIADIRPHIPKVPVLALTATATPEVVDDIQEKLKFRKPNVFQKSFERKNVAYVVQHEEDKLTRTLRILNKIPGSGVIYVRNRKRTREVAEFLGQHGIAASYYHAGLDPKTRDERQQWWIENRIRVIVATNAFGMGIDKADVRFVVHLDLPDTLEAYFQEAGRGGRDEKKAWAVLLFSKADKLELEKRIDLTYPEMDVIRNVYQGLANYYQLATGAGEGLTQPFDLADFSTRYNLKPILVYSSLQLLAREGLIVFTENINLPSRIKFSVNNAELYKFQIANASFDPFIKLLLRSYTGVFDDYSKISEQELARRANVPFGEISKMLSRLDELEILTYLPQTNQPQLTFLKGRTDAKKLALSPATYKRRKALAVERTGAVIHYATSITKCRSQLLLAYFGETESYRCGICDICLERNKLQLSHLEFDQVLEQVKKHVTNAPSTIEELVQSTKGASEDRVIKVIRWLIDNGKMEMNQEQKLEWIT